MSAGTQVNSRTFEPPPGYSEKVEFSEEQLFIEDLNNNDKELWLFQAPQDLDFIVLKNRDMSMQGETVFQNEDCLISEMCHKMSVRVFETESKLADYQLLLPSRSNSGWFLAPLPFAGQVNLTDYFNRPTHVSLQSSPQKAKKNISDLKQRYSPLGSGTPKHKPLAKSNSSSENTSSETPVSAKKRVTFKTPLTETQEQVIPRTAGNSDQEILVSPMAAIFEKASKSKALHERETFRENENPDKAKPKKKKRNSFPNESDIKSFIVEEKISHKMLHSEEVESSTDYRSDSPSVDAGSLNELPSNGEFEDNSAMQRKSKRKRKADKSFIGECAENDNSLCDISHKKLKKRKKSKERTDCLTSKTEVIPNVQPLETSSSKESSDESFSTEADNSGYQDSKHLLTLKKKAEKPLLKNKNIDNNKQDAQQSRKTTKRKREPSQSDSPQDNRKYKKRKTFTHLQENDSSEADILNSFFTHSQKCNKSDNYKQTALCSDTKDATIVVKTNSLEDSSHHRSVKHAKSKISTKQCLGISNVESKMQPPSITSLTQANEMDLSPKVYCSEKAQNSEHLVTVDNKIETFTSDTTSDNSDQGSPFRGIQKLHTKKVKSKNEPTSCDISQSNKTSNKRKASSYSRKSDESKTSNLVSEKNKLSHSFLLAGPHKYTTLENFEQGINPSGDKELKTEGESSGHDSFQTVASTRKKKRRKERANVSGRLAEMDISLAQCEEKNVIAKQEALESAFNIHEHFEQPSAYEELNAGKSSEHDSSQTETKVVTSKKKKKKKEHGNVSNRLSKMDIPFTQFEEKKVVVKQEVCENETKPSEKDKHFKQPSAKKELSNGESSENDRSQIETKVTIKKKKKKKKEHTNVSGRLVEMDVPLTEEEMTSVKQEPCESETVPLEMSTVNIKQEVFSNSEDESLSSKKQLFEKVKAKVKKEKRPYPTIKVKKEINAER